MYIMVKQKATLFIILSKNLHVAFLGDIFRIFLCLTVINMAVLICHCTTWWNALEVLHNGEKWRRGTEFMDLN
jgi:hypothetical protein